MSHPDLSQRLAVVGDFVPEPACLAGIGPDHVYLLVALVLRGKIEYVVAGEAAQGPHELARKRVREDGLGDHIAIRLASNPDVIQPQDGITAITIASMEGSLIRGILEADKSNQHLSGQERLIFQPSIKEHTLWPWLQESQYKIQSKKILEENRKVYEIIVAEKERKPITHNETEPMFEPFLLGEKSGIFRSKWTGELQQRETIREQLKQATNQEAR